MNNPKKHILSAALMLALSNTAAAREDSAAFSPESTREYREGYNLILNSQWPEAAQAFENLVRNHPDSGWVDDAAFWRCYAGGQMRDSAEDTFGCYEEHIRRYPRSEWNDDAKRAMVRLAKRLDRDGNASFGQRVREFGREDDDHEMLQVLVALGEIGDERSIDVIFQRLDTTEDEHLRARIVEVLDDVESPRVEQKLIEILNGDASEMVRVAAVESLARNDAIDAMATLRQVAENTSQPSQVRSEAIDQLSEYPGPDFVAWLSRLALDADPQVAEDALDEISDVGSQAALQALSDLISQVPNAELRRDIVRELEDFESEAAVEALLKIAQSDPDPRIRRAATDSLGDMELASAREALIQLLQSMNEEE